VKAFARPSCAAACAPTRRLRERRRPSGGRRLPDGSDTLRRVGEHDVEIRSYVLQPYQKVKDLRTNVERSDPQKVLDGDLDEFMAASLAARVGEGAKEAG